MHVKIYCFANINLLLFYRSRCRRPRRCLSFPSLWFRNLFTAVTWYHTHPLCCITPGKRIYRRSFHKPSWLPWAPYPQHVEILSINKINIRQNNKNVKKSLIFYPLKGIYPPPYDCGKEPNRTECKAQLPFSTLCTDTPSPQKKKKSETIFAKNGNLNSIPNLWVSSLRRSRSGRSHAMFPVPRVHNSHLHYPQVTGHKTPLFSCLTTHMEKYKRNLPLKLKSKTFLGLTGFPFAACSLK